MKRPAGLLLVSLLAVTPVSAQLSPHPLGENCSACTEGSRQYLQADGKGRVFILRSRDLLVYPVTSSGLGEPARLKALPGESTRTVMAAALSPDGRDWLLLAFGVPRTVRYFQGGEEKPVPEPSWAVAAVGLPGGAPVLAVQAGMRDSVADAAWPEGDPPLLLRRTASKWETLAAEPYDLEALGVDPKDIPGALKTGQFINTLRASREVFLASGPKGSFWLAARNSYRLRQFTAAGRLRAEVQLGENKIELQPRDAADVKKLSEQGSQMESQWERQWVRSMASAPVPKRSIEAFAVAIDGTAYVLARSQGGKLALDRFGSGCSCLERAKVEFPSFEGSIQMAAGKDGLYFASTSGTGGRWRLPWEEIETAKWKEVDGAKVTFHAANGK
jgi:hypothetical protein